MPDAKKFERGERFYGGTKDRVGDFRSLRTVRKKRGVVERSKVRVYREASVNCEIA